MFDRSEASIAALRLIKPFENCRLEAYLCPAGVPTIGWGHTGPDVHIGMTIDQQEADRLLAADLQKFVEGVDSAVFVPLSPLEAGALVSLAYNIGLGAFYKSTLLRLVNEQRYQEAGREFARWNKSNGQVSSGLVRRRAAEAEMFMEASNE